MGLDFVEVTMEIEDAFKISLGDDQFEGLINDRDILVGDLYEHILTKLHLRDVGRYSIRLNFDLWQEIRQLLSDVTGVPSHRIELKTPLETLFPRDTRTDVWERLHEASPYRIPKLDYPWIVRATAFAFTIAVVATEQFQLWQRGPGMGWLWPAAGLLGMWMFVETYAKVIAALRRYRTSFPKGMTTVKELCRTVMAANYADICHDAGLPLDDRCLEVWQKLTEILATTLDVDSDRITFKTRLFADLGMS
jgi:acyl carrier protein